MVMPGGSTVPPPNDPRIPIQPINPINPVDQKDIRRKKGLSKAKRNSQIYVIVGYFVFAFGINGVTLGDYGFFVSTGVFVMILGLLEAIFAVAKYSK